MNRISVFCGSSPGNDEIYEQTARRLGEILAERKTGIVYGGTNIGLMNAVASGALSRGGEVTGILPEFIRKKGFAHPHLTELIIVDSMHERKRRMYELSDGMIALPGGLGTLEEFFEVLAWSQLGLHKKPVGMLNVKGFWDPLKTLTQKMVSEGFLREENRKMILISDEIIDLLDSMEKYSAPSVEKWIQRDSNLA